ncbi:aminotransferase class I/II-fold pyridoxal phosphate-dependent enzyme [Kitasatospora purpeofusca]|uniref:aminotransferase class I/II-fold pyridoxal phosphate-dependent enzyme n=1 Tax=Kitasatospora purpeofusca TaxID=67352 RepID=UPI0035DCC56F
MRNTTPSTAPVECLAAFGALRAGTAQHTFEIGEGCNHYPPAPEVGRHLATLLHDLATQGSLSLYADPFRGGAKAAFADLLTARFGVTLAAQDITFVQGGTEAISLITHHLANAGHSLTLPLPNYYAFDQSAVRWGAPVERYYRHDGAVQHTGAGSGRRTALVEVLPNGVTGTYYTRPDVSADFTLLDVVFQHGALGDPAGLERAIHDRIRDLDLAHSAVIMTASKDLSLPGLRAAAIITRNQALRAHLAADAFDRAPTAAPLASLLMVLYAGVLHAYHGPAELLGERHHVAQQIAAAHGLPDLPCTGALGRVHAHLDAMADRFRRNAALLADPDGPFAYAPGLTPAAGYSAFPSLSRPRADFLAWVRECGRNGLRLSPTVVHGGTAAAWQALLPGQHLRVNLSESTERTAAGLQYLEAALGRTAASKMAGAASG